jgi:hypothetical protein
MLLIKSIKLRGPGGSGLYLVCRVLQANSDVPSVHRIPGVRESTVQNPMSNRVRESRTQGPTESESPEPNVQQSQKVQNPRSNRVRESRTQGPTESESPEPNVQQSQKVQNPRSNRVRESMPSVIILSTKPHLTKTPPR